MRGTFISFESTAEGLGKTTQAKRLVSKLNEIGVDAIYTKEPNGLDLGLRDILKDYKGQMSNVTELLLMVADRSHHVEQLIWPALQQGKTVVCDRYFDSTLCYQGAGRGFRDEVLWNLHGLSTGMLMPNQTFVLHGIPYRERDFEDRFEREDDYFHTRVAQKMLQLSQTASRYTVISTSDKSEDEIADQIFKVIQYYL